MLFTNRTINKNDSLKNRLTFRVGGLATAAGVGLMLGGLFGLYAGIVMFKAAAAVGGVSALIALDTALVGAIWGATMGAAGAVGFYAAKSALGVLDWVLVSKQLLKEQSALPEILVPQNVVDNLREEKMMKPAPTTAPAPAPKPSAPKPKFAPEMKP